MRNWEFLCNGGNINQDIRENSMEYNMEFFYKVIRKVLYDL